MGRWKQLGLQQAFSDGEEGRRGLAEVAWQVSGLHQCCPGCVHLPGRLRAEVTRRCGLRQVVRDCRRVAGKHEEVVVCKGRLVTESVGLCVPVWVWQQGRPFGPHTARDVGLGA